MDDRAEVEALYEAWTKSADFWPRPRESHVTKAFYAGFQAAITAHEATLRERGELGECAELEAMKKAAREWAEAYDRDQGPDDMDAEADKVLPAALALGRSLRLGEG